MNQRRVIENLKADFHYLENGNLREDSGSRHCLETWTQQEWMHHAVTWTVNLLKPAEGQEEARQEGQRGCWTDVKSWSGLSLCSCLNDETS